MSDLVERVKKSSESAIVEAKQSLDQAVSHYTTVRQFGGPAEIEHAKGRLHTAVITLYWRMRGNLRTSDAWEDLEEYDDWDDDILWSGRDTQSGEQIELTGLRDLDDWVAAETTIEEELAGPKYSGKTEERTISQRLPAQAALAASQLLSQEYTRYGWDAEKDEREPTSELDKETLEKFQERVQELQEES